MDPSKIIPKLVERQPLKEGQTEGRVHLADNINRDTISDEAIKKPQPEQAKSREISLDDMKMWLLVGITKDDKYIYQMNEGMSINDLLGLRAFLDMKINSDVSVHQKTGVGLVKPSVDYLVKTQETYSKILATRLGEVTQAFQAQAASLQTFVNQIQSSSLEAKVKAVPKTKKVSKKKTPKKR